MSLLFRQQHSQQVESEIVNLQNYIAKYQPEIVLAIGQSFGGTDGRWLQLKTIKTFIGIDLADGIHGGLDYNNRVNLINETQQYCLQHGIEYFSITDDSTKKSSVDKLKLFLNGRKIDFAFIDGDHRYEGVAKDFLLYSQFVKEYGIIAFHDIRQSSFHENHNSFVHTFWKDIKPFYKTSAEYITNNVEECFIKMDFSRPDGFGGIGILHHKKNDFDLAKNFLHEKLFKKNIPVSVIIGTCGKNNSIEICLDSIIRNNNKESLFYVSSIHIIVNGSSEEWYNNIKNKYISSDITFHFEYHKEPLGFSKAYNEGLKQSYNEYNIVLNDDTELLDDTWLQKLCEPLYSKPNVGLSSVAIKEEDGCALGFCFATRKSILQEVGLFDEGFEQGYYEDNEFTNRIKNAGYDVEGISVISFNNSNRTLQFPINHHGMKTFSSLYSQEEVKNIINDNKTKYELYSNSNIQYCIIGSSYSYLCDVFLQDKIYIDDTTCILIINLTDKSAKELLSINQKYKNNIHVIEPIEKQKCDKENIESISKAFFGNKNVLYCSDVNIQDENITWMALFNDHASMGVLSQNIIEQLDNKTFNKHVKNIIAPANTKNKYINQLLNKEPIEKDTAIMFSYPDMQYEMDDYTMKIIYTGLDTLNGITNIHVNANKADVLFTPSMYSKNNMLNCGITKPIIVFPHGINTKLFTYSENIKKDSFTFVYCGECSDRKGTFQLLDAFKKLVQQDKSLRLILCSNKDVLFYNNDLLLKKIKALQLENYIELIQENNSQEEIVNIMKRGDCYVYPSRADSFGMTVLEAMAIGLPVITHKNIGVSEFIEGKYIEVKSKEVKIQNHPLYAEGNWYEINHHELSKAMKEVKDNYELYSNKSKEYSEYIHKNFSWEAVVKNIEPTLKVLTQNKRKKKISVFITSFNRPDYLYKTIDSIISKQYEDIDYQYEICVVEQSNKNIQDKVVSTLENKYKNIVKHIYVAQDNLGQRGAINIAYHNNWFEDSDYIMLTDQDNIFIKPLSTYSYVLDRYKDCEIVTGYLSKEHETNSIFKDNKLGTIIKKSTCRAGHMFYRKNDLLKLFPLELDLKYGQQGNSSWNIGLDWTLISWHPDSPLAKGRTEYIYCIPNGVEHIGYESTWRSTNKSMINSEEIEQDIQYTIQENYFNNELVRSL